MRWTLIQTAFLGDVILTLPLLRAIREYDASSEIQFITRPEAVNAIETAAGVIDAVAYNKRGSDSGISGWLRMAKRIRNFHPEIVLVPHRSARSVALAGFSRAKTRIGYDRAAHIPGLTKRVAYRKTAHETARLLDLLEPITGKPGSATIPVMQLTDSDRLGAKKIIGEANNSIAIAPGAVWHTKRYPINRFIAVAERLVQSGYRIVAIGGTADRELCQQVATAGKGVSVAGELTPRESAATIANCRLLITNDSAPLHLAQAVGTPTLAIFGATVPAFGFGPQGQYDRVLGRELPCRPCAIHGGNQCPEKHFQCMLTLDPELVVTNAVAMIEQVKHQ